jgi:hypothetical protein
MNLKHKISLIDGTSIVVDRVWYNNNRVGFSQNGKVGMCSCKFIKKIEMNRI